MTQLIESNRHPVYNTQFLITNPESIKKKEGFIYVGFKDKFIADTIDVVHIPLAPLQSFIPVNFELCGKRLEGGF
jgi:hypothetical protein